MLMVAFQQTVTVASKRSDQLCKIKASPVVVCVVTNELIGKVQERWGQGGHNTPQHVLGC